MEYQTAKRQFRVRLSAVANVCEKFRPEASANRKTRRTGKRIEIPFDVTFN